MAYVAIKYLVGTRVITDHYHGLNNPRLIVKDGCILLCDNSDWDAPKAIFKDVISVAEKG